LTVRRLTPEDAALWRDVRLRMLEAEPQNFGASRDSWVDRPLSDWANMLRRNAVVVSMAGERAVGAMGLWPQDEPTTRHRGILFGVWLDPGFRGTGRAADMLSEIVAVAKERGIAQIELNVHDENARARSFYERHLFAAYGHLPRAVRYDGEYSDDVLMVRMLDA
jgi:RimJ/RimL family protein N-acetyltransferase